MIANLPRGFPNGDYLRVSCWILLRYGPVAGNCDGNVILDDAGTHRDFSCSLSVASSINGYTHPTCVAISFRGDNCHTNRKGKRRMSQYRSRAKRLSSWRKFADIGLRISDCGFGIWNLRWRQ
jgi:hypothetical protein